MNLTRRDTIIIAVLCNVFILVFSIVTGAWSGPQQQSQKSVVPELPERHPERELPSEDHLLAFSHPNVSMDVQESEDSYVFDELDQLLEEYLPSEVPVERRKEEKPAEKPQSLITTTDVSKKPADSNVQDPVKWVSSKRTGRGRTYTVQKGDNPWIIAKKCTISVDRLLQLNGLDEAKAKNLKIGQVLVLEPISDQDERL